MWSLHVTALSAAFIVAGVAGHWPRYLYPGGLGERRVPDLAPANGISFPQRRVQQRQRGPR